MTRRQTSTQSESLLDSIWNAFLGMFGSGARKAPQSPAPSTASSRSAVNNWPVYVEFKGRNPRNGETVELRFGETISHPSVNGKSFEAAYVSEKRYAIVHVPEVIANHSGIRISVYVGGDKVGKSGFPLEGSIITVLRQ